MSLARITRIAVRFSPWSTECRSARDFLARITSAQETNPECQIKTELRLSGRPSVTVEYSNKRSDTFDTSGLSAPQILARLKSLSDEMDTSDILSKVGVANTKLEVPVDVGAGHHRKASLEIIVSRRKDDLLECNRGVYVDMLGLEAYFIGLRGLALPYWERRSC